jgi:glucosamine--fructose-6-phosphate aminotransferase (isomerizing)
MTSGEFTYQEIISQPDVWQQTLDGYTPQAVPLLAHAARWRSAACLITGCGSTHYLSLTAAAIFRRLGLNARALPASEIVFYPDLLPPAPAVLLAISRSGTTSETLWAVETFRRRYPGSPVIAITTLPEATLAQASDFVLAAPAAAEQSIAQTRSFTSMLLLAQLLAGSLAGQAGYAKQLSALPPRLVQLLPGFAGLARQLGEEASLQRFFFLGNGPLFGLAGEAMVKTKEITCSWAEAFHPLEFRHGPMSVVNHQSLVVGLLSDSAAAAELQVLRDMQGLGARTLVICDQAHPSALAGLDHSAILASGLDEWARGPLYLPLIQLAAYYRALAKNLDPDHPTNLSMVVEL